MRKAREQELYGSAKSAAPNATGRARKTWPKASRGVSNPTVSSSLVRAEPVERWRRQEPDGSEGRVDGREASMMVKADNFYKDGLKGGKAIGQELRRMRF